MKKKLLIILLAAVSVFGQRTLTLDEAMEIALENSPDIQQSRLSLERSQEYLNAQRASLKSRFSLNLNPINVSNGRQFNQFYNQWNTNETTSSSGDFRIVQPIPWTDGTLSFINRLEWMDSYSEFQDERSETFNNNLYLSYNQPLFTYNRTKLALRELELDLENTQISYALQQLTLEFNITQSFYNLYQQRMSLEIAEEEYVNQTQSYEIIKNKVDAGLSAKEELYQAELNQMSSESSLENAKVTLENAQDSFKKMAGLPLDENITAAADVAHEPVEIDLQQAVQSGLKNRYELRQRTNDIESAYANLVQVSADNEFRGDLDLSYGFIGTDEVFDNMYDKPTRNQRVSLSLEIPLFDWGAKKSRVKGAQATIKSRELSLKEEEKDIQIEIRQSYRNLRNLEQQIKIAQTSVRNAELTYDINLERYKNGDLTSMDLNLYQEQLSTQKISLVNALIDYKLALLTMKIQTMWDFEKNRSALEGLD